MFNSVYPLLDTIQSPDDLRRLAPEQLPQLAAELRAFLLQALNQCGGHFAANLGTVELTIALHYIFHTPHDKLVWDVGHQAYPHKILTGRKNKITSIRKTHGLAPFPKREESDYDAFGVGHSSTSISAALGMALAEKLRGGQQQAIAIIGDGGLTGGMAFEALNHAGSIDANLLVVLNDNEMSISPNVGALSNYFARILSGKIYSGFREGSKKILEILPPGLRDFARKTENHVKGFMTPGTLFEELGFHYFGPIDGHDLNILISTLENLRELRGPRLLHVITKKGKGYLPAENDPVKYHAVKKGYLENSSAKTPISTPTYSEIFSQFICDLALVDKRMVVITPAMCEGSGITEFSQKFPERYFDVGIAEQHSVTLAAGLACDHIKPIVAIYSTFLQRAYDQLIHDVALQNLDVTFAIDRAGLVGADGPTHAGSFDLTYLRCVPNLVIMAPADEDECYRMLYTAYLHPGPAAVRYPRGSGSGKAVTAGWNEIPFGKAEIRRQGKKIALLAFGSLVSTAEKVAETLDATCVNMRFVKPLDEACVLALAKSCELLVTCEENVIAGGAGSAVNELLLREGIPCPVLNLGLPDAFIEHGDCKTLLQLCGLDVNGMIKQIEYYLNSIKFFMATK